MKLIKVMDPDAIENGVWFQLNSPGTTEPLFRDPVAKTLPCKVKVRSDKSKAFRSADFDFANNLQNRLAKAKATERAAIQKGAYTERRPYWFASLLVCTDNCDSEKAGQVTGTFEEMVALAQESENIWLVDQVLALGLGEQNFPAAVGNVEPPPPLAKVGDDEPK